MNAYKLTAPAKDYIWGGNKLRGYGIKSAKDKIAEAWVLSMHKDGESTLADGVPLSRAFSKKDWGKNAEGFEFFPLLIKLIDAKDNLSVQVHPSDEYALKNEGQFGKTEMWYVVESDPGAGLYVGFKKDVTLSEFENSIKDNTVTDKLNFFEVKKGDCFFIPSGTVHAIGKGCTIAEVQQNSNLTYRVYDYGRVGADGKPRELHVEKALKVTDLSAYKKASFSGGAIADCEYFTVKLEKGDFTAGFDDSFTGLLVLEGEGVIDGQKASRGDSFFIPAGKRASVKGGASIMVSYVKDNKINSK
jgi:mannose-6-phosphate isomerase